MRIDHLLEHQRQVFSFEFFPPQTDEGMETLKRALWDLKDDGPGFASVTYGAAGSTRERTVEITKWIKQELGIEAMAHLSCVGEPVERLREILDGIQAAGIENVLALRGDPPQGRDEWEATAGGLTYSRELIELIRDEYDFTIGAACFPEVHIHAASAEDDLRYAKEKVDAGARFLITQLFFDNQAYWDYVGRAREAGIEVPIVPGIMPIGNVDQIKRFTELCGACIPDRLVAALEARASQPQAVADFGVAYATLQCAELLAAGAPGIHFYTLNRSPATRAILGALRCLAPWRVSSAA
jgi:methylenetetrahydrofolate reductase (NADPH)